MCGRGPFAILRTCVSCAAVGWLVLELIVVGRLSFVVCSGNLKLCTFPSQCPGRGPLANGRVAVIAVPCTIVSNAGVPLLSLFCEQLWSLLAGTSIAGGGLSALVEPSTSEQTNKHGKFWAG